MPLTPRVFALRIIILVALVASTLLTVDHLTAGPSFCPLEKACDQAAQSELGTFAGVPTSILGMSAFFVLLLLTLTPPRFTGYFLSAAGAAAATAGVCLILHQGIVLRSYCPLCVVADGAAIVAGLLILGWSTPLWGTRWAVPESMASKVAWILGAWLVIVAPFAMRRAQPPPAWEEVTPLTESELAFTDAVPEILNGTRHVPAATVAATQAVELLLAPRGDQTREPAAPTISSEPIQEMPEPPPVVAPSAADPDRPLLTSEPDRSLTTSMEVPAAEPSRAPAEPETLPEVEPKVVIVEYLNAYCLHCRKTHRRLERVLRELDVPVRRRRVYTWSAEGYPTWARALAFAQTEGREDELFEELLIARSEHRVDVIAAAQRADLDTWALKRALNDPAPPMRLVRDRQLAGKAALKGLPTLDIGRRRLMGEQSEANLRAAVEAALRDARATNDPER